MNSKRFAIIGNSGSGKSTLAKWMAEQYNLEAIDLDEVYWLPDQPGVARPGEDSEAMLRERLQHLSGWIIEGCYETLIDSVADLEPTLIWLEPGEEACRRHCQERPWEPHKYPSKQAQDANLPMLLDWVSDYYRRDGAMSFKAHEAFFQGWSGAKKQLTDV
ncbi:MAG: hypothetical protein NXH85_17105 [Pseudomonadaceae bacterium]|nr:hypothetical protein [Pseudomonadaceae bacterium]